MRHTTAEWNKMLIAQMTDEHLLNMINVCFKNINDAMSFLNWENKITDITLIASWCKLPDVKEIRKEVQKWTVMLMPYVFEWTIRWQNYTAQLQELFNRQSSISPNVSLSIWYQNTFND